MNILFLTLANINNINERGIYQDLLRKFRDEGHDVTIVSPSERRQGVSTKLEKVDGVRILKVKTFNITKTNVLEKGIGTLAIEFQYLKAIKKFLSDIKFDLVLYSTPPITFTKVINFIKERDSSYSYLLLKDIFPQNAVDMKMFRKNGWIYKYFRSKEKELYEISDTIGCMSEGNMEYILKHNPYLQCSKLEINPNSISPIATRLLPNVTKKLDIRNKLGLPEDKTIFLYGGNLGKPQGLNFLLEVIEKCRNKNAFFLVVGSGTEFKRIENWFSINKPLNASLLQKLGKNDYDTLLFACDVGLIFLDVNFTIPNFPSRLLSYLEGGKPIIAATDVVSDVGDVVENANCGFKVLSGDRKKMLEAVDFFCNEDNVLKYGVNSRSLLEEEFTVDISYKLIISKINRDV